MTELERYIFEQALLAVDVYKILSSLSFKKGKSKPPINDVKQKVDKILKCEGSEIVKRSSQVYISNEITVYKLYNRFTSDYLSDLEVYNFRNESVTKNRCDFYRSAGEHIKSIMYFLQETLDEYNGNNRNVYMAGQGALLLLKGFFVKSNLKSIKHFIPKPQKGLARISTTTDYFVETLPQHIDDILFKCEQVADITVSKNTDATIVNTICTAGELASLRGLLESTIITKKQAEIINSASSSSNIALSGSAQFDGDFEQTLIRKARLLFDDIPDKIYGIIKSIEDNLSPEFEEVKFFVNELCKEAEYPKFYELNQDKEETNEQVLENEDVDDFEKVVNIEKSITKEKNNENLDNFVFEKQKKKSKTRKKIDLKNIGFAIALPFKKIGIFIWKFIKRTGLMFANMFKTIGRFFAELFSLLFGFLSKHKIVSVLLGLIIIATPIITLLVLHKPCHYENVKITVESTCFVEGSAVVTCKEHGETKTIILPKKHTLGNDNKCIECGTEVGLQEDKYIPKYPEHSENFKCVYGYNEINELITASYYEGEAFEEIKFDNIKANKVVIYSHENLVLTFSECEIENLMIVGDVKEISIDNKKIENLIVYGDVESVNLKQKNKIKVFAITGKVTFIETEK